MTDRRTRKTEQALQQAFARLIQEKELNRISVKELCERADINKSTFYLHYRDIYDLAAQVKQQLLDNVYSIIAEYDILEFASCSPRIWERILQLFKESSPLYVAYLTSSSLFLLNPVLDEALILRLLEKAKKDHPELTPDSLKKLHITITFTISGFLGLMQSLDLEELSKAVFFISKRLDF